MIRRITLACLWLLGSLSATLHAQIDIVGPGPNVVNFNGFDGTGVAPSPTSGQLNAAWWAFTGFSTGDADFGDTNTAGDYAKGTTTGGISSGGLYAFDDGTNQMIWIQPTGSDFTPGTATLLYRNATGSTITDISFSYVLTVLNDGDRGNTFNVTWSSDGSNYVAVAGMDYLSPETSDGTTIVDTLTGTLSGLNIADGDSIYMRWESDDNLGGGSRDEFGIDDVTISVTTGTPAPSVPVYDIATITTNDANGLSDSTGVNCEIRGVVYGIDLQGGGSVQFTVIDATGGIGVFSSNAFGYTVQEGDSVHIPGTVGAFNGLTQMSPDTIELISSGNTLISPAVVTTLDESTESELIRINGVTLVDAAQWPASGSANVDIDTGTDTLTMRIDSDTDIDGTTPPAGAFDVVGLGGQFDNSSPFDEGYQLLPRSTADIITGTTPPPANLYDIATVTTVDANGVADSLGASVEIRGIVYGIDLQGGGSVQFTVIDATGGIGVFSSNAFGYTVTEGDSVHIPGTIGQFNGLTQINPDTIEVKSSGNALVMPAVVTALDESTESELIRINGVTLVDAAQWPASGSANVDIDTGTDTLTMRIDSDTDIDGTTAPVGTFDVVGLGGQFDNSSPFDEGYQILPRYIQDIISSTPPGGVDSFPLYPIATVTTNDVDGVADSLNVMCELRGVVYGIDLQGGSSIQFTLIDATGGIGLFSSDNFGYTVNEGDSLHVFGTISQFNGLTQISPDSLSFIGAANPPLITPAVVSALDESTESELIRINGLFLVDPAQWPASGSANVDVSNGTDTFTMRIDSDTDIDGTPAPVGSFDLQGIGGQFDNSSPFDEGYQILPRGLTDIIPLPTPGLSFSPAGAVVVNEGDGSLNFDIELSGVFPDTVSVDVSISGVSTATAMDDYMGFMDTTITFLPGDNTPQGLSVMLVDDSDVEPTESLRFELSNAMGAVLGDSVLTFEIEDNDYIDYPIGLVTADNDNDGIMDSLGVRCELRGVVYGTDLRTGDGVQFTLRDSTDGIAVFSFAYPEAFYMVAEGDSIHVQGTTDQFNGLAEIIPDSIILISSGNALAAPVVVTELNETTENEWVQLRCVQIVDTTQWPDDGNNQNLDVTNGVDTFTIRIDRDTEIDGTPAPAGWLNITGSGGQFDGGTPALSGYQVLPQFLSNIEQRPDPTVDFGMAEMTVNESAGTLTFGIKIADANPDSTMITVGVDASSTATQGTDYDFVNTTVKAAGCDSVMITLDIDITNDTDAEGDETIVLVFGEITNGSAGAQDTLTVTITEADAISGLLNDDAIRAYPNPTQGLLKLDASVRMETATLSAMNGQILEAKTLNDFAGEINIDRLPAGIYLLTVDTKEGRWIEKIVKQ